jgi:hypothetical protein
VIKGGFDGPSDHFIVDTLRFHLGDSVRQGVEKPLFFFRAGRIEDRSVRGVVVPEMSFVLIFLYGVVHGIA